MIKDKKESEWINTVLKKGTIADKLAAHTLLIHESNNWSSLDTLIEMVDTKKCRRQCLMAMTTLRELFIDSLNPKKRESNLKSEEDKTRAIFYYTKFIDRLSLVASDNLEESRKKAMWVLSELLNRYPENKEYIIEKLVDKMGDKVPMLASKAGSLVEKAVNSEKDEVRLQTIHHVQRFLKRPKQAARARFYATSLLTRIKLVRGHHEMANQLIETYLSLYTTLTKENNLDSKLMTAILVGIHRAYPYSKLANDIFESHLQTLYTLVHRVNFRMRVVAMVLIKNIVVKRSQLAKCPIEDRFYNLIFGQLICPELLVSSRQQAFADLLVSTINEDKVLERREAFVKRMLLVALNAEPQFANILLSSITKVKGFNLSLSVKAGEADKELDEELDEDEDGPRNSWVHKKRKTSDGCDLLARNPRAAKPKQLNELYFLRQYFDPKISGLARSIIGENDTNKPCQEG